MHAYEIHGDFGLENLKRVERPTPQPGPGQVLMRCEATSLNYRDLMMVLGLYNPKQPLPLIPCSDCAGTVEAVGDGVTTHSPGDRILGAFSQSWHSGRASPDKMRTSTLGGPLDGGLATHVLLEADAALPIPEWMTFEEAATLPCAALTAWSALFEVSQTQPGDKVLLLGTGGVSIFALQLARMAGAEVMITSSSDAKLDRAKELGASAVLNYKENPDWGKAARKWAGAGVDHVVEVGGAGTLAQSIRATRIGGTISVIGVLSGVSEALDVRPVLMNQLRLQGILVGHSEGLSRLLTAVDAHKLHPVLDRVFSFAEAVKAFEYMQSGAHFGKVVILTQED